MNNTDIMAIRYPSRVNRTAANEDLYHAKQSFKNLFSKPSTEAFPAGPAPKAAVNYRGRIAYDPEKCINCGACVGNCPFGAITAAKEG